MKTFIVHTAGGKEIKVEAAAYLFDGSMLRFYSTEKMDTEVATFFNTQIAGVQEVDPESLKVKTGHGV